MKGAIKTMTEAGTNRVGNRFDTAMSDDEYTAAFLKQTEMVQAAVAAFHADCERRSEELGPFGANVQATLNRDGHLEDLYIDPTALTRYTHLELEDVITDALRGGAERLGAVLVETWHDHYEAEHSPIRELLEE